MNFKNLKIKLTKTKILFIIITCIAIYLRMINIVSEQLWHDEAGTIYYANSTWEHLYREVSAEKNPILYYTILKLWISVFGQSIFATRLLSVIFSVLTIPVLFYLGKEIKNEKLSLIMIFLYAISPFSIWYANEVRMYSLLHLLFTIDLYFAIKCVKNPIERKYYAYFSITAVCLIYTHYIGVVYLIILGLGIFYFNRKEKNFYKNAFFSLIFIIICYLPWIPQAIRDVLEGPTAYTGGRLNLINLSYWSFYLFVAPVPSYINDPYVLNLIMLAFLINIPILILSFIGILGFLYQLKSKDYPELKKLFTFILLTLILFFGIQIIIGFLIPDTFQAKNLIGGLSLVLVLEGFGLYYLFLEPNKSASKYRFKKLLKVIKLKDLKKFGYVLIFSILICNLVIFPIFKSVYLQKPDWDGCVKKLKDKFEDSDIVINQYGINQLPAEMKYYCEIHDFDFEDNTFNLEYDKDEIKDFIDDLYKENISRVWIIGYWHHITDPDGETEDKLIDKYNFDEIKEYNFRLDLTLTLYEIP